MSKVEEKLFENRYRVDEGHSHVELKDPDICRTCATPACTWACPAACYTVNEEGGGVTLSSDGCLECGTCRLVCNEHFNIEWAHPRGGYGVLYKFG